MVQMLAKSDIARNEEATTNTPTTSNANQITDINENKEAFIIWKSIQTVYYDQFLKSTGYPVVWSYIWAARYTHQMSTSENEDSNKKLQTKVFDNSLCKRNDNLAVEQTTINVLFV